MLIFTLKVEKNSY